MTDERAFAIRGALRKAHRIDAAVIAFNGSFWTRLSAQAYNEMDDYKRLAEALGMMAKRARSLAPASLPKGRRD